ncbi:MAG: hypothetical protein J0L76_11730 [Rhodobacterales bacterium]|nr:hypothetical protein [Rhodobacterales bacterium]
MTGCKYCVRILVVALVPATASAEVLTWGQVAVSAGAVHIGNREENALDISDTNPVSKDIAGRVGVDWGGFGAELGLQFGDYANADGADFGHSWGRQATLRLTFDLSPDIVVGAVAGKGNAQPLDDPRASLNFRAIEAAYSVGAWQLGLQHGRFDATDDELTNAFHDGKFTRIAAAYSLGSGGMITGSIGLFDGLQDTGSTKTMNGSTWSVEYARQFGERPLAWTVGLDGGQFDNDGLPGDLGALRTTRASVGLTVWFGDGDLASAKRRGFVGQPDFGRVIDAGNEVD